jgi:uncharacterized protein (TIRG00374 family)
MLAASLWLVWPNEHSQAVLRDAVGRLTFTGFAPTVLGVFALMAVVQLARAYRWSYLLAPIGVRLGFARLMAVSSVGFMAILVIPARLGELVRPALIRKKGHVSATAALGTVAVERIIDGLMVSVIVFVTFVSLHRADSPGWMMPTAYVSLGVFGVCLVGLLFALRWPDWTVRTFLTVTLLARFAPGFARKLEGKLHDLIRGFAVQKDRKNLAAFLLWSLAYWVANGLSCWVLARGMGLDITATGGFAIMGLVAVGITLPNSPGLVGQFQWFTLLGLSLYLPGAASKDSAIYGTAFAMANVHYGLQVLWYIGCGALGLATPWVSFHDLWHARDPASDDEKKLATP